MTGQAVTSRLGPAQLGTTRLGSAQLDIAQLDIAQLDSAPLGITRLGTAQRIRARVRARRIRASLGTARLVTACVVTARLVTASLVGAHLWALTLLLAGCTNNPYPERDAAAKVLYLPFDDAPKTLDPAVAYTTSAHAITGEVYDTLLQYHFLARPYRLIPALATSVPLAQHRQDGKVVYRFEVRQGLHFQEDACFGRSQPGSRTRAITADDFIFELLRIADPAVNSPVIEPFFNVSGFERFSKRVAALRDSPATARLPAKALYAKGGGVEGLRKLGDHTFEVVLDQPYPQLLYWFAMPFTAPVPWEAVDTYDGHDGREHFADHPVGSGPYVLSHYDKQSRMVLERNPRWYGAEHPEWHAPGATYPTEGTEADRLAGRLGPEIAGKALPFIDRLEYRREKESIPSFSKFLQGYYDMSGVIRESFDKVIRENGLSPEMAAMGMQLDKSVTPAVYYIGFNMQDRVVGSAGGDRSRKLRQAMSLAVDVPEYTRLFMNGRGVPATSPLPPGLFGFEESYQNPFRKVDLGRAKALLAEAGYAGGLDPATGKPLHLTFDVGDTSQEALLRYQFWVGCWRKIGLDVEVAATTYNKFQDKVRHGAYQLFFWGWVADYPDPENFLFLLWSKMSRSRSGGPNTANFEHPRYDELFLAMKARDNDPDRARIIREMRDILEAERPWIELFYPETYALYHGWLRYVKPSGISNPNYKYYVLDPARRATTRKEWNRPVVWPAYALFALALAIVIPGVRTFLRERQ